MKFDSGGAVKQDQACELNFPGWNKLRSISPFYFIQPSIIYENSMGGGVGFPCFVACRPPPLSLGNFPRVTGRPV